MATRTPLIKSPVAATPMAFVSSMISACHRMGHNPQSALAAAGISDSDLIRTDGRITATQMEKLSDQIMRELDDEALGWFSRKLPWGSYGMLARASISAPNLGIAMKRWCRHHRLLTADVLLEINVVEQLSDDRQSYAAITLIEVAPADWLCGDIREFCHVSLLRNLLGFSSWLVDSKLPVSAAEFAYDAPAHADVYTILFNSQTTFNQPKTQILIDSGYLSLPIRRDESALHKMLKNALPLTVRAYRKDRLLIDRVKQAMHSHPHTLQNAQALASHLHLSERSLHRQLKAEGESLQKLKDSIRLEGIKILLTSTTRPIKQIAEQSGFKDEKSLARAFKSWTGHTPSNYRTKTAKTPDIKVESN